MKRFFLSMWLTGAAIFLSLSCFGANIHQGDQPVSWRVKQSKVASEPSGNVYEITCTVITSPDWHTYDFGPYTDGPNPTVLTVSGQGIKLIGKPYVKKGLVKEEDPLFNITVGLLGNGAVIAQKVEVTSPSATTADVNIEWQACNVGNCVLGEKSYTVALPAAAVSENEEVVQTPEETPETQALSEEEPIAEENIENEQDPFTPVNAGRSIWSFILEAIGWGLLALLTPCVFPMVPMTVSFFLKQNENRPAKGKFMAILYGICIVAIYTIPIAVLILLTYLIGGGSVTADIFNWLSTNWIPNVIFFIIFLLFALSFFGAFEIVLPSWMVNKSDSKSGKGGVLGVFFMALTLVLVSFSCTGPIVGTVLIKSTQGEVWTPIIVMLVFSIVFAIPFTLFAFAPSLLKNLKSGGWLNSVKVVLGFIELALGMKFLSVADQTYHWGILDREVYLAFWIVIFSLLGFYLLGKLRFKYDSPKEHISVLRLMLAIIDFAFVVYMIPGMWGAPLKALSGYLPPIQTQDFVVSYTSGAAINASATKEIKETSLSDLKAPKYSDRLHLPHGLKGYFTLNEALEASKRENKPIFFDFTGHGCVNCREMEARVWSDPEVLSLLRDEYIICSLYADDKMTVDEEDFLTLPNGKVLKDMGKINSRIVLDMFNVNAQPFYILLNSEGGQLVPPMGYNLNVAEYVSFLRSGLEAFKKGPGEH